MALFFARQSHMMPDADSPGYEAFRPEGWSGSSMTLTYIALPDTKMSANRFVYHVDSAFKFTVTWEMYEDELWKTQDSYSCTKRGRGHFAGRFKSRDKAR
jgi:hypothetical protein